MRNEKMRTKKNKKEGTKEMGVKKKITMSYVLVIAITLLISILGLFCIYSLNNSIKVLVTGPEVADQCIKQIRIDTNVAARSVREMVLTDSKTDRADCEATFDEMMDDMAVQFASLEATGVVDEAEYQAFSDAATQWATDAYTIIDTIDNGDIATATQMILNTCTPQLDNLVVLAEAMDDDIQGAIDSESSQCLTIYRFSIGLVATSVVVLLIITFFIARSIIKAIMVPLEEIEACARKLSQGELHTEIQYTSGNEFGTLADSLRDCFHTLASYVDDISDALNRFAEGNMETEPKVQDWRGDFVAIKHSIATFKHNMSDTIIGMQKVAEEVECGAQQVSATSMELAEGATEQANVMAEFTATVDDVSGQVSKNANYASTISHQVEEVGVEIANSNEKMREMVASMKEIETSSEKIHAIIDTINDIAAQTNLLALNASIEAARAGEFGRGFAVVANQVTDLATQSAEAAKQSAMLIEDSIQEVEKGMALTNEIAAQQETVASNTKNIVEEVENVAQTLKAQSESFEQINEGITQINEVIQTNSATSEECAASSQEMSNQASTLDGLVREFKVAKGA
jgi:methyl-accepting chemotaxis protein